MFQNINQGEINQRPLNTVKNMKKTTSHMYALTELSHFHDILGQP